MLLEIPEELENLKLPSLALIEQYKDIKDRKIYICEEINESLNDATRLIMNYNAEDRGKSIEDRKPIFVYIQSFGGDLYSAYTFINTIRCSKTPVITVNLGVAMSAGALIFLAGHKRYMHKFGTVMLHTGSGGCSGTFEQAEQQMDNYKKLIGIMKDYILDRTKIDTKLYTKNSKKDWYIMADECIELGIADEIITDLDNII